MDYIFSTKNLKFKDIISYPDIDIEKNICSFIVGKSGSGKSTLLKLFNQTISHTDGMILYDQSDVLSMDTIKLRREVLLGGQGVYLFDDTLEANFISFHKYRNSTISTKEMMLFLDICCLDKPLNSNCKTMSGGEKARAFLAICLSFKPIVLLLDEPTAALDNENGTQVISNIISYCKESGITPILVSHDMVLTERFADKIITLGGTVSG